MIDFMLFSIGTSFAFLIVCCGLRLVLPYCVNRKKGWD